ncbi:MAG: tetratricopeptide repeat protein [Thermodesulfobacteriota bacterium]
MQDKIHWYEEVISQDPGSNLFFPLARLYSENNEPEKAVKTLGNGLQKHPWHLEAKLLLIDILSRSGRLEEAGQSTLEVTSVLQKHPLLWANWAHRLESDGSREAALAVRFLGLLFSGSQPDLMEIVDQGLKSLFPACEAAEKSLTGVPPGPRDDLIPTDPLFGPGSEPGSAREQEAEPQPVEPGQPGKAADIRAGEEAPAQESPASEAETYQTRTMAEILSDQGDYDESIRIYRHLLQKAVDDQERLELEASLDRIQKLRETRETETSEPDPARKTKPDKADLIQELERLASRLDRIA